MRFQSANMSLAHPNLVCLNLSGTAVDTKGLEEALVLKKLKVISVMSTLCKCPYPVGM